MPHGAGCEVKLDGRLGKRKGREEVVQGWERIRSFGRSQAVFDLFENMALAPALCVCVCVCERSSFMG